MAFVSFTHQSMPTTTDALIAALRSALDQTSPLDDFIRIIRDLTRFESTYQMSSSEFFVRFEKGEMDDRVDYVRWANKYEIFLEIKKDLDSLFLLVSRFAIPVAAK